MKTLLLTLSVLAILAGTQAIRPSAFFEFAGHKEFLSSEATKPHLLKQSQHWFNDQLINHFNLSDTRTFKQRYYYSDTHWNQETGPVILYICGEGTCNGVPDNKMFISTLAKRYNALIIALEHRFYGPSQPFDDLSVESLRYLTVDNALADLAHFINWAKNEPSLNIGNDRPWITYGGSYPGALSAWFRYKYPHLTVGAIASSAVINSITDFRDFDHQIYISTLRSGKQCPDRIQELVRHVEERLLSSNSIEFKKGYKAENLTDLEFLYYYSDNIAGLVQYGKRPHLCEEIVGAELFDDRRETVKQFLLNSSSTDEYAMLRVKNDSFWPDRNMRQWTWQTCLELGWFQTAYTKPEESLRSSKLNIDFFLNFCEDVFGKGIVPDSHLSNLKRGGLSLDVNNLIMVNGIEDPWQWASRLENYGSVKSYVADCPTCGHCIDIATPASTDAWSLWWTRTKIMYNVGRWIGKSLIFDD